MSRSTTFIGRSAGVVIKPGGASASNDGMPLVNAEVLPRGNVAVDRVVQADQSFLDQHHSATAVIGLVIE